MSNDPSGAFDAPPPDPLDELSPAFYSAFEDRFRGSSEEVARRQSNYLPILDKAGVLRSGAPVLDIGGGRGEWLRLLEQHGYAVRGVDLNEEFVLRCQRQGLDVVRGEATQYLRSRPADDFAAITAFHVVEHLPFSGLLELVGEIHRALRPGGIMIVETPNPENLVVGAHTFHLDPSHLAPIPPDLLLFLTEQAGFPTACIARANADSLGLPLAYVSNETPHSLQLNAAIHLLNLHLYMAPDYAVIAQKSGGVDSIAGSAELHRLCQAAPPDMGRFRLSEAEAKARESEVRAQKAETRARRAEARARTAEAEAFEAGVKAQELDAQLVGAYSSASWRITRPLRGAKRLARRGTPHLKSMPMRVVRAPLHWLLAREASREFVIRKVKRFPTLDRSLRKAILRIKGAPSCPVDGPGGMLPRRVEELSASARRALRTLNQARAGQAKRHGEG
jgi:O-antigen chain-terminating methyltransferase